MDLMPAILIQTGHVRFVDGPGAAAIATDGGEARQPASGEPDPAAVATRRRRRVLDPADVDRDRNGGQVEPGGPAMGALFTALAGAVRAVVRDVLGESDHIAVEESLAEVQARRTACVRGAFRRARLALDHGEGLDDDQLEDEWLGYAALLVQVDRIVGDLSAPLPT
jgi:hypothetical protein